MNHDDVKKLYQDWTEERVDKKTRLEVEEHLGACDTCRTYFENLSLLLEKPDPALLPRLEPDPFLPAKIRAVFDTKQARSTARRGLLWARVSLAGAALAVAGAAGVLLGTGLSDVSYSSEETEIAQAYYDAFSQSVFADDWEDVVSYDEDENNGSM